MSLIIFDCDGVLVESEIILVSTVLEFLASDGLIIEREEYIRRFMGMPANLWEVEISKHITAHFGEPPTQDYFKSIYQLTAKKMSEELTAVAYARSSIEKLDYDLCVASSSSTKGLQWKLEQAELLDLFNPNIFSTNLVKKGKPAPDLFLYAADKMSAKVDCCIVIEDSANGVKAAKAAGMKAIGFTAASHCLSFHGDILIEEGADLVVNSYSELASAIERLQS